MQRSKKEFPFVADLLLEFKKAKLSARAQLFLVSLMALYYERERRKGGEVTIGFTEGSHFDFDITVRDSEISRRFNFSVDTLWRIRKDLKKKTPITYRRTKVFKRGVKYPYKARFKKNFDHEFYYGFSVLKKNEKIILVPSKIIYNKKLTTKEKLSILWHSKLKEEFARSPELKEIEEASEISVKTIRKAKEKCPQIFAE